MLFHCCEELQHSLLLLCGSHNEKLFDKRSFCFSTVLMLSEQSIDRHRLLPSLRSSLYQWLLVQSFLLLFAQLIGISALVFVLCFCLHTFSVLFCLCTFTICLLARAVEASRKAWKVDMYQVTNRAKVGWVHDDRTTNDDDIDRLSRAEDVRDFRCTSCVNLSISFFDFRKRCEQ